MNAFAANTLTRTSTFAVRPTLKKDVISITLDGEEMILDTAPAKIDSSITSDVYVPMLSFCEGMGAKVLKWDEESQSALAVFREFAIDATAGNGQLIWTYQNQLAAETLSWLQGKKELSEVFSFADENRNNS